MEVQEYSRKNNNTDTVEAEPFATILSVHGTSCISTVAQKP